MSKKCVLETRGISKSFSNVRVLNDINFQLHAGEIHALLGENGAGKSTFIKILSGVYMSDSGSVYLNGEEIKPQNPAHIMKLGVATIHQELVLAPHLSIAENICLGDIPSSRGLVNWELVLDRAKQALETIGLSLDPMTPVAELSVAQKQLVAIARALSFKANVIIMDEPTSALSEDEVDNLFRIMRELQGRGVAFIYISHRLNEIFEIGNTVTVLRDGNLIATADVKDVNSEQLIHWIVGRDPDQVDYRSVGAKVGEKILEVRDLGNDKLDNVSFKLHRGEILGITGLIGAGKTELALSLFGAYPVQSGQLVLKGEVVEFHSPAQAIEAGISLIPEDRRAQSLFLQLPVRRNLSTSWPKEIVRGVLVDRRKETKLAQDYISALSIRTTGTEQQIEYLSGGNQQKVVLGRWLAKNTDIYVLDEPTRGVDVGAKFEVYQIIEKLAEQGCGVILLSSDLPEILNVSSRIMVLYEGSIVAELDPKETTREKILDYAMGNFEKSSLGRRE